METTQIFLGNNSLQTAAKTVAGEIVTLATEKYFKISNYDAMPPFFMNIVSDSDLWMFISSNGALTAGRRNPDNALFPYYTDDRIYDSNEITGSKTIVLVKKDGKTLLWEPFSSKYEGVYSYTRNIYKNIIGNKLVFEEVNHDLGLSFQYAWENCDAFGFVKKSRVTNLNDVTAEIRLLDGVQNILPAMVERKFQLEYSTLVDGYKKSELLGDSRLAVFTLSSVPTDKAEPSESLKANTVWSSGMENAKILLSSGQLDAFRNGLAVSTENDVRAARGAYFLQGEFTLSPNGEKDWYIVADLNKTHKDVVTLSQLLASGEDLPARITAEISADNDRLDMKIAQADGGQLTADPRNVFRHFSNTLYNIMRGGIFDDGYVVDKNDFQKFIQTANKAAAEKFATIFDELPAQFNFNDLAKRLSTADRDLERLYGQYLPLIFSRRHGDPSRPWNQFSIDLRDEAGNKMLDYQGNWRDIFQNWEALALSYPEYLENMIGKFLSASTADGYNPYRVMRDGFDWEIIDPVDPWSYIGYWGDHQIIYLLKLLELSHKYHPGKLQSLLGKEIFTYANVPYKIKPYADILENPHDTIDFDFELNEWIEDRVAAIGEDGKFLALADGEIYHVSLLEKLLVPVLVKLSNFVPGAGIWMNTQRPEWNDANNALVGYGASMVTLCYLRRFFEFGLTFFPAADAGQVEVSEEVLAFFNQLKTGLEKFQGLLSGDIDDKARKDFLDHFGQAGSDYRMTLYKEGFSGKKQSLAINDMRTFLELGLKYIDHSIASNQREDNLYHAYNLIDLREKDAVSIRHLYEMLEGQVAVLSSGYLTAEDSDTLLTALRQSVLYREDQNSYLLYPNRQLPRFTEKNNISGKMIAASGLSENCAVFNNENIMTRDASGVWHFNSKLRNARLLREALLAVREDGTELSDQEIAKTLDIYETTFDHQSFTGRSGTFYKYEGLGSIYWHMVSKLLLAVQDTFFGAMETNASAESLTALRAHYYDIREGIGIHKSPEVYGAFSTDAYSHTPGHSGAQQPGMTGQVKEDILSRFGEFGIVIRAGKICFNPALLSKEEFLSSPQTFTYYDVNNQQETIALDAGTLAFTMCQVPFVFVLANEKNVFVTGKDGNENEMAGYEIDTALSRSIFQRDGNVKQVRVQIIT